MITITVKRVLQNDISGGGDREGGVVDVSTLRMRKITMNCDEGHRNKRSRGLK